MDELIKRITSQLGIDESVATGATQKAMAMVKEHAGDDLFSKISSAIPGAADAASAGSEGAAGGADAGGGLLGKLADMASSTLSGSAGSSLDLAATLRNAGVDSNKVVDLMSMIIGYLKENVGDETMDQILAKFPMLKALLA